MANLKLENIENPSISQGILDGAKKQYGFAPDMYVKMGKNPSLLDSYVYAYNSFRANSGFNSVEQEVVLLSIAYENNCPVCMAAHSFVADVMSKVPVEVTDAIRDGRPVPDVKLAALSKLTRSLTVNRGWVSQQEIDAFTDAGYSEVHVLGIITAIGAKTMSNYANHNTDPQVDAAFVGRTWKKKSKEEVVYLTINTIPNPENMEGFQLYLSKIMPIFNAYGGVKIERYKTVEQLMGNSGIIMLGIFEFPNEQKIKDMLAGEEFNALSTLRAEAFKQLDLSICKPF